MIKQLAERRDAKYGVVATKFRNSFIAARTHKRQNSWFFSTSDTPVISEF